MGRRELSLSLIVFTMSIYCYLLDSLKERPYLSFIINLIISVYIYGGCIRGVVSLGHVK